MAIPLAPPIIAGGKWLLGVLGVTIVGGTAAVVLPRVKVRPRAVNCCNPAIFPTWPREVRNLKGSSWHDWYKYQEQITGAYEYRCYSASGANVWADGLLAPSCWLREVKYSDKSDATTFFNLEKLSKYPFLYEGLSGEFSRYAAVCNNPAPPVEICWNVGLRVTCNTAAIAAFFSVLCTNAGIQRFLVTPQVYRKI